MIIDMVDGLENDMRILFMRLQTRRGSDRPLYGRTEGERVL